MLNSTVWRRQHNLSINSETEHLAPNVGMSGLGNRIGWLTSVVGAAPGAVPAVVLH